MPAAAEPKPIVPIIPARAKPEVEEAPEPEPAKRYVALRNFTGRAWTQLVSFVEGEELSPEIGRFMHEHGAPVRPID